MQIIFLGTASCYPTSHRAVSCTAVRFDDGDVWLFDCGEGSQVQIQKSSVQPGKITKVFITHLHGDHLFGLPGLICTLGNQVAERPDFVLSIYGPQGIRRYVRESLNLSRSPLPFKYIVHELIPNLQNLPKELEDWKIEEDASGPLHPQEIIGKNIQEKNGVWNVLTEKKMEVRGGPLVHRVPCFGFVIQESDLPGTINVEELKRRGLPPGPLYSKLKSGLDVVLADGKIIKSKEVMGPPKKGRKITILGDTSDSSGILECAKESDILVHEATLENALEAKAIENGHSTPSMAASFAGLTNSKHLILTHFSQRYRTQSDSSGDESASSKILRDEALQTVEKLNLKCDVTLAEDLLQISVKHPQ